MEVQKVSPFFFCCSETSYPNSPLSFVIFLENHPKTNYRPSPVYLLQRTTSFCPQMDIRWSTGSISNIRSGPVAASSGSGWVRVQVHGLGQAPRTCTGMSERLEPGRKPLKIMRAVVRWRVPAGQLSSEAAWEQCKRSEARQRLDFAERDPNRASKQRFPEGQYSRRSGHQV